MTSSYKQMEQSFETTASEHRIFRVCNFGWNDAETEDPEYLGYAFYGLGYLGHAFSFQDGWPGTVNRHPTKV